jgi:mannose-6-phosphate isomerase-like protein (cupin superfamily)
VDDEELYFIVSGEGIMVVDGEERRGGPGSAILVLSGGSLGIRNESTQDLQLSVVCAQSAGQER